MYILRYFILGFASTFISIPLFLIDSSFLSFIMVSIMIMLPPILLSRINRHYYAAIGIIMLISLFFVSDILRCVMGFLSFSAWKVWFLTKVDNPNYPLHVNFFNLGSITTILLTCSTNRLLIIFALMCNVVCMLLTNKIWHKSRVVGIIN